MKAITANNSICFELHNSWNGELWILPRSRNNLPGGKKILLQQIKLEVKSYDFNQKLA